MTDRDGRKWFGATRTSMPVYAAAIFTVALFIFEAAAIPSTYENGVIAKHLAGGTYLRLIFVLTLAFASLVLNAFFFWAAFTSKLWLRLIYLAIFSIFTIGEYEIYRAFQRHSYFYDIFGLSVVSTHSIIEASLSYFAPLCLVSIIAFAVLLFVTRKYNKNSVGTLAAVLLAFAIFFGLTSYFTSNSFHVTALASGFRAAVSYPVIYYIGTIDGRSQKLYYDLDRSKPSFRARTSPANNIVLIIDESVRADHLSIDGYDKDTTPELTCLKSKGMLKNWGIASSGATCSISSNVLLLTGVNKLPDPEFAIYTQPTIFQYALAMNYRTHYLDGNISGIWNGKTIDIPDFGEWLQYDHFLAKADGKRFNIDQKVAEHVKEILSSSTGNFIWINKFGVHIPYTESYPNADYKGNAENRINIYDPSLSPDKLIGEYDAAVAYNSASFFETLFSDGVPPDTIFIYTSDHGQTLGQNGATVSHCSTSRPEAMVPLFAVADPAVMPSFDTGFAAGHANIFATLLDLMAYPESERKFAYAPSLLKVKAADSTPRTYFAGDLAGRSDGQVLPFDK